MKCVKCVNERTNITQTLPHPSGGTKRRRKCYDCGATFVTLESVIDAAPKMGGWNKGTGKPKQLYSKADAALIQKVKTDIRRKNEDTVAKQRTKIADYYVEGDYDDA